MLLAQNETGTSDSKNVGHFDTGRIYVKQHSNGDMTLEAYSDDLGVWLPIKVYSQDQAETISPTHGEMRVNVSSGEFSVSIETG